MLHHRPHRSLRTTTLIHDDDDKHWRRRRRQHSTGDLQFFQGSKQVLGGGLILAAEELGIQLLITVKGDATCSFICIIYHGIESVVNLGNISVCTTGDHILTELIKTNG